MATLAGSTIASTYTYLLKMDGTSGLTSSLVAVQDGDATDSALKISTTSASVAHTVTTAASTPIALLVDANTSGVAAQNSVGMHIDFDRTVAGSGTAAHNDIGINLDVNSASLGTSSLVGMDIDVVGATSGTSTATGLAVTVGSADTNYALVTSGGNVGIGTAAPAKPIHIYGSGSQGLRIESTSATARDYDIYTNGDEIFIEGVGGSSGALKIGENSSFGIDLDLQSSFKLDTNSKISLSNNDSGTSNTLFGKLAGNAIASGGTYNIAIGENALSTEDTGDYNVAVGYNALQDLNYDGTGGNTGLGNFTGANITTGTANTAVGHNSLGTATTALKNTALGYASMADVKAGVAVDGCIAIGHSALIGNSSNTTAINGTVAIGTSALQALTSGTTNTAVGYQTGLLCTTASDNTYIGHSAGVATHADDFGTTAVGSGAYSGTHTGSVNQYNTAIGYNSMDAAMNAGLNNTAVGAKSLGALVGGQGNVAVGVDAGLLVVGGLNNIFIGKEAGKTTTTVDKAVIVGYLAGAGVMTAAADATVAVGAESLAALTSGARNLAIGYQAADGLTTSSDNLAIGYGALGSATTNTTQNIAIGNYALDSIDAGATVTDNVAIGYSAGTAISTGDGNTLIGMQAGNSIQAGGSNVIIGKDAAANAIDAGNCIVIGADATGIESNTVTLGNADITAVYAAQDGDAVVYCGGINMSLNQPAAPAGVMTSEHLDAYEEGTWTPVLSDGSNNATTGTHASTYTKVGRQVTISSYYVAFSLGSVSGDLRITGLPFTAQNSNARASFNFGYGASLAVTSGTVVAGYVEANTTYINLTNWDVAGGTSSLQHGEFTANGVVMFSATYFV
mgnify:FL=1